MAKIPCPNCGGDMSLFPASDRAPARTSTCNRCSMTLDAAQEAAAHRAEKNQLNKLGRHELSGV